VEAASEEVHSLAFQSDEFGPSESPIGGDVDPRVVSVGYCVGEACDFARPEFFSGSYHNILDVGSAFPVSLMLLTVVSLLLGFVVIGLQRAPQSDGSIGMLLVSAALGGSALAFFVASVLSVPVWIWAGQVNAGTLTVAEGISRSQGLASTSQTIILLFGLGGLMIGLTVLGILCWRFGWTPAVIFWATIMTAAIIVIGGFAITLFWVALGLPPLLWTLMIGGSLTIRGSYETRP
jgi:hypothetical protein